MTSGVYSVRRHATMLVLAVALVSSNVFGSATLDTAEIFGGARLQVNSTVLHRSGEWFEVRAFGGNTGLGTALTQKMSLSSTTSSRAVM